MEAGSFYASTGPLIHELWYEDGKVRIKCDPAAKIVANYGTVRAKMALAGETEGDLTEAAFDVSRNDGYIRITVFDKDGKHAYTNAYFTEDFM